MVTNFSAAEKDSGVKLGLLVRLLSGMSFSQFDEVWPRGGSPPPEAYFRDDTNLTWEKISREARWAVGIAGAVWWNFRLADGLVTVALCNSCLLYTSPSPRDRQKSRMPSSA